MSYQGEFGVSFLVLIQWLRTRRNSVVDFFFLAKTSVDLPWEEVPPPSISLDKEVAANEEGIDDDTNAAADAADAAPDGDDYAAADNDNTTMPPTKVKPLPTKPTKKDIAAAAVKPPPPAAAAAATSFSVDANNPLTENYYTDEAYN